jgi:hypothetical protein
MSTWSVQPGGPAFSRPAQSQTVRQALGRLCTLVGTCRRCRHVPTGIIRCRHGANRLLTVPTLSRAVLGCTAVTRPAYVGPQFAVQGCSEGTSCGFAFLYTQYFVLQYYILQYYISTVFPTACGNFLESAQRYRINGSSYTKNGSYTRSIPLYIMVLSCTTSIYCRCIYVRMYVC